MKFDIIYLFPIIMIVLDVGAGIVYLCNGDVTSPTTKVVGFYRAI